MNVAVTTEHRFFRSPDGAIWTQGAHAYSFWRRYLAVFDGVRVLARVSDAPAPAPDWRAASGPGVVFAALPDYLGPWQYLAQSVRFHRTLGLAAPAGEAVILRVSSQIAGRLEPVLVRRGQPFGVEVINDPFDVYAPGAVDYRLRALFRWRFTRQLRRQCRRAAGAAYVTQRALQARYPCPRFEAAVSDVEIPAQALRTEPRRFGPPGTCREFRLIAVASLAQMYKAPDVLIRAVAEVVRAGLPVNLRIAGDGKHRPPMERLAAELGLDHRVRFLGQVPAGERVREELDASDAFVLPSRCEGLPRAMVEAMARSLPSVATAVGGIPELLPPDDLVPPGDPASLARKLIEILNDPGRMNAMAERNLRRAADFREDLLEARRADFFHEIRRCTENWLAGRLSRRCRQPAEVVEG